MGSTRRRGSVALALLVGTTAVSLCVTDGAAAQDRPSAAVLRTATANGAPEELAQTLDRALRARVAALGQVEPRGSVTLDLADIQLALGCEGEARSCLASVAGELGVRYLLIPNLDRAGSQLVLTVALFDVQSSDEATRASRQAPVDDPSPLLDAIDEVLIELFGAPSPSDGASDSSPPPPVAEVVPVHDDTGIVGGAVVTAIGVAALGVAIGLGVASLSEADASTQATPTPADADRALAHQRTASDLALGADLAFAIGGAVAIGGLVWLVVSAASGDAPPAVSAAAFATPSGGGLALFGALPEARR